MFASFTYVEQDVVALHVVTDSWDLRTDHLKEPRPIGRCEETSENILRPSEVGTTSLKERTIAAESNKESSSLRTFIYKKSSDCNVIDLDRLCLFRLMF